MRVSLPTIAAVTVDEPSTSIGPFTNVAGDADAIFLLERVDRRNFKLRERFRYVDQKTKSAFVVPADLNTFESDLASVPWFVVWFVPPNGTHTPAALLHDALTTEDREPPNYEGPEVTRKEADRIFRDAMGELGVPVVRRWLMWAAVTVATLWSERGAARWYWRVLIALSAIAFFVLGLLQVLDLLDVKRAPALPWMGDRAVWEELALALLVTLLATALSSLLWLKRWGVGALLGPTVTLFATPVAAVVIVTGIYAAIELLISGPTERRGPLILKNRASD